MGQYEIRKPTHSVYQVIGEGRQTTWIRIGAGWENRDGKGISLAMDAVPLTGRIVVRAADAENGRGGQQ